MTYKLTIKTPFTSDDDVTIGGLSKGAAIRKLGAICKSRGLTYERKEAPYYYIHGNQVNVGIASIVED